MSTNTPAQAAAKRQSWAQADGYDTWEEYVEYAATLRGRDPDNICGAAARKRDTHKDAFPGPATKKPCQGTPVEGMSRCRHHGGKSLVGSSAPAYKHGEHSRFAGLPARIQERAIEAEQRPDLISLREDLAVSYALYQDLWSKLDTGESTWAWSTLRDAKHELDKANQEWRDAPSGSEEKEKAARKRGRKLGTYLKISDELIDEAMGESHLRAEIRACQDHMRKLREAERRLAESADLFVRVEQMRTFARALVADARDCMQIAADKGFDYAWSEFMRRYKAKTNHKKEIVQ